MHPRIEFATSMSRSATVYTFHVTTVRRSGNEIYLTRLYLIADASNDFLEARQSSSNKILRIGGSSYCGNARRIMARTRSLDGIERKEEGESIIYEKYNSPLLLR